MSLPSPDRLRRHARPSMTLRRYRTHALVLLALYMQACASWAHSSDTPRRLIEDERPSSVRITNTDETQQVVPRPAMQGDSITRASVQCQPPGDGRACQTTTSWKTILILGGVALVAYVVGSLVLNAG